jgi:hypothetical protein
VINQAELVMKKPKGKSVGLIPLVVFLLATGWVGYVTVSIIKGEGYIWLAVIAGAAVIGVCIAYFTIGSQPEVRYIKGKITNAEHITIDNYALVGGNPKGMVRAIRVRLTNHDTLMHRLTVNITANGSHPRSREIAVYPGVTTDVRVPLPTAVPVEDIDSLSIELKQT